MRAILAAAAAITSLTTCAHAADLGPYRPARPAPAPAYYDSKPTLFSWRGFYAGINAGYGWGNTDDVGLTSSVNGFLGEAGSLKSGGWLAGAQAGYNIQMGALVLGIEGDFQGADINDSITGVIPGAPPIGVTASTDIGWISTIRGRLGVAADRLMIYGTAGVAFADIDYRVSASDGVNSVSMSNDGWRTGYVVGGGVEWAIDPRWTMKIEYQYLNFGKETLTGAVTAGGVPTGELVSTNETTDLHTVRFGVNYKF